MTPSSEAKIVYTKTHHVIGKNSVFHLDLNRDGTIDFTIQNRNCPYGSATCTTSGWNILTARGATGNSVEGTNERFSFWAANLGTGERISNKQIYASGGLMAEQCRGGPCSTSKTETFGNWPNVRNRYLGLKFQIDKKTHYGWARLSVKASKKCLLMIAALTGYGYETVVDKPIVTGKTKGSHGIAVQAGSIGHLARGASAIAWRPE